jgi:hypothetical protein
MQRQSISPKGALTFWAPEPVAVEAFAEALRTAGFPECTPNPRTDRSALEAAIKDTYGTKDRLVQARKKPNQHGVELVEVERDEVRNHYVTSFGAKVQEGQVVTDYGRADRETLQEQYEAAKAMLTPNAVSKALLDILTKLQGSRPLKPGVYWLPPDTLEKWREVIWAVEGICAADVVVCEVEMDPSLADVVLDRFAEEVNAEVLEILEALGKDTLAPEGVEARKDAAQSLLEKIEVYANALDTDLQELRRVAQLAKSAAVRAAMKQMPTLAVGV